MAADTDRQSDGTENVAYRYSDGDGTIHIVDALEAVPPEYRAAAKRVVLAGGRRALEAVKGQVRNQDWPGVARFVGDLDGPSVVVGFAVGLLGALGFTILRITGRIVLKLALVLVVGALFFGAYFGWVRRSAGLSSDAFSTSGALIDEAKNAAKQIREQKKKQKKILEDLEESHR
ncbi:MAG: hypothetical protein H6729_06610 [Deltaproteobacteria bacterium]|nr:hypothetical protein [Deltaproteobacteria bacterium]